MSTQTLVYLYNQRELVVLLDNNNPVRRYEKVYAKPINISRGVDNLVEFAFVNQEQKPVNLTGLEITCRVINSENDKIILQKALDPIYSHTGIMLLKVTKNELEDVSPSKCYYTLEVEMNGLNRPVFVDSFSDVRGNLTILSGVLPKLVESTNLIIPSHITPTPNSPVTYVTSIFESKEKSFLTIQCMVESFTGTIVVEGSNIPTFSSFYEIYVENFDNITNAYFKHIEGYHPYMRIKIINQGTDENTSQLMGDVRAILVR